MPIYTKTGDKGKTSTFSGKRVSKSSKLISAMGTIDELNSYLGIIVSCYYDSNHSSGELKKIINIQENLFTINAILTGASLKFPDKETKNLEEEIDKIEGRLPVQKNFIFYGGAPRAALIFYARALCRRAERELVEFSKEQKVHEAVLIYFNRLSDYLFMMARSANIENGEKESFWKTKK